MIPSEITAEDVYAAIAEVDKAGVPSGRDSTGYHLVYQGRRYPPKYLVSLAAKYAVGRHLLPGEFNGGHETNWFLQRLGFEIVHSAVARQPNRRPERREPKGRRSQHDERCQPCKSAGAALLQKLFSAVELGRTFPIGSAPEALVSSAHAISLRRIFEALQQQRGFTSTTFRLCWSAILAGTLSASSSPSPDMPPGLMPKLTVGFPSSSVVTLGRSRAKNALVVSINLPTVVLIDSAIAFAVAVTNELPVTHFV